MSPKELEQLLKVCRKYGVTELSLGTVSFKIDPTEASPQFAKQAASASNEPTKGPNYSDEDLMFWSSAAPSQE